MKQISKWIKIAVLLAALPASSRAEEIIVSWESNGVLMAEGLTAGSTCTVEWASNLNQMFTNDITKGVSPPNSLF